MLVSWELEIDVDDRGNADTVNSVYSFSFASLLEHLPYQVVCTICIDMRAMHTFDKDGSHVVWNFFDGSIASAKFLNIIVGLLIGIQEFSVASAEISIITGRRWLTLIVGRTMGNNMLVAL